MDNSYSTQTDARAVSSAELRVSLSSCRRSAHTGNRWTSRRHTRRAGRGNRGLARTRITKAECLGSDAHADIVLYTAFAK